MSHDDDLAMVRKLDDALFVAERSGRPEDWTYYYGLRDAADRLLGITQVAELTPIHQDGRVSA